MTSFVSFFLTFEVAFFTNSTRIQIVDFTIFIEKNDQQSAIFHSSALKVFDLNRQQNHSQTASPPEP